MVNKRRRTDALDDFRNLVSAMAARCSKQLHGRWVHSHLARVGVGGATH